RKAPPPRPAAGTPSSRPPALLAIPAVKTWTAGTQTRSCASSTPFPAMTSAAASRGGATDRRLSTGKTLDRHGEAGHAVLAGDRRDGAFANGFEEGGKFRAQRLVMTDGEVPHRVAAVLLEAVTLGHLPRQQIADHVLALGSDVYGPRLERREPV